MDCLKKIKKTSLKKKYLIAKVSKKKLYFSALKIGGEMAEWSKAHAWRACKRQKRFLGSNPSLSAFIKRLIINRIISKSIY